MQKITTVGQLKEAILLLKIMHSQEELALKEQFYLLSESFRPVNLIKGAFKDVTTSVGLKTNIIDTAIGMSTGYLTRKVLTGASGNPFVRLLGILLQVGVSNMVTKHPGAIKSSGLQLLKKIFGRQRNDSIASP